MTDVIATTRPSRRTVLRGLGAGIGLGAVAAVPAPSLLGVGTRAASAATPTGRLVVVFLRGGMDGLSACVPYTDDAYRAARPSIAVPPDAVIDLDGRFGLHPALAPIAPFVDEGRLSFVHAAGNPAKDRSHFTAQTAVEQGLAGPGPDGLGWLGRHLSSSDGTSGAAFRAVGLGANTSRSLAGYAEAVMVPSLATFGLGGVSGLTAELDRTLRQLYFGRDPSEQMGQAALAAVSEISAITGGAPEGTPEDDARFIDARALLGADLGIEVVTLDLGGWDTHEGMGDHTGGVMATLLDGLATRLADFQAGLDEDGHDDVTTIVMSEFGRRVDQNGSGGTDHGYGGVMLAMGAGLGATPVIADWPGLEPDARDDGDLAVTTDYRDVLGELVRDRLGADDLGVVFPDHTPSPVGLTA